MDVKIFKASEVLDNPDRKVMSPENRYWHCMTAVDEFVIIYGGCSLNEQIFAELWIYDCINQKWRLFKLPNQLRRTLRNSSICAYGSKIYIFGIPDVSESYDIDATLFSFDVRSLTWMDLFHESNKKGDRPPRMNTSSIMFGNDSIFILGTDLYDVSVMYTFSLQAFRIYVVEPVRGFPHPNFDGHYTLYKNKIYYFGKLCYGPAQFSQVRVFDLSTYIWEWRKTQNKIYPENRSDHAFIFNANCGYLIGGTLSSNFHESSGGYVMSNYSIDKPLPLERGELWKVDLDTLEWTKLKTLDTRRYHLQACIVNNCYLYFFGGFESGGQVGLKRIVIGVPSLKFRSGETFSTAKDESNT
ncbi:Kelch domain-containing protein 10 [Thelohanellus kitauei]|uniref:Kelch domain-containing protein 10 n=1 Tax=Thelohanellus kitauei TaxID=669202 RepID=A0A0C2MSJ9_THEKT|nr:Kelch domain-containing protein 10 [Thelohanellus kitauei]